MERWIAVPDYNGRYYVSDLGSIISVKKQKADIMKNNLTHNGYSFVCLSINSKVKTKMVHRLVYESFKGKTDLQIDHIIEGNKSDNRLCNLQAISQRDNASKYQSSRKTTSTFLGVSKWKNKSKSQITVNNKRIYLGIYESENEAHLAYINYLKQLNETTK